MEAADFEWVIVPEEIRPGPVQMALEEVAARRVAEGGPALVRVFRWEPSTLSMGYGQDPATVDWRYCEEQGIDVTRRQTGGGGIYHDSVGDISYSIVVPRSAVSGDLLEAYHTLCEPVVTFFDALGIDAGYAPVELDAIYEPACYLRDVHPAHDILVDGRKISGNAQYRQREAVIQHGSITFETVPDTHLAIFQDSGVEVDEFEDRVTGITDHIDIRRDEAVAVFEDVFRSWTSAVDGEWSDTELADATELADEKYASDAWLHRPAP